MDSTRVTSSQLCV